MWPATVQTARYNESNGSEAQRDQPRACRGDSAVREPNENAASPRSVSDRVSSRGPAPRPGRGVPRAAEEHQRRRDSRPGEACTCNAALANSDGQRPGDVHRREPPDSVPQAAAAGEAPSGRDECDERDEHGHGEVEPGHDSTPRAGRKSVARDSRRAASATRRRRQQPARLRARAIASQTVLPRLPTILACYPRHLVSRARRWVRQLLSSPARVASIVAIAAALLWWQWPTIAGHDKRTDVVLLTDGFLTSDGAFR